MKYNRALITGASSGIGAAIATELCNKNVEVLGVARNKSKLVKVLESLPLEKRKYFIPLVADISLDSDIDKIVKNCRKMGGVDLLINNAGVGVSKSFEKHNKADIKDIISTNIIGSMILTRGLLLSTPEGMPFHIVFVSSLAGKIGFPDLSVYSASKFAVEGLAEALRHEYAYKPVRITILRPGITDTNFFKVAGMTDYYQSVKGSNKIHSPQSVARKLISNIDGNKSEITVGSDGLFLKILPFIPFGKRFKVLDITNYFQ